MQILYCDTCGMRVPEVDIAEKRALKTEEKVVCAKCHTPAPASGSRVVRRSGIITLPNAPKERGSEKAIPSATRVTPARSASKSDPEKSSVMTIGLVLGGLGVLLGVAAFLTSGKAKPENTTTAATPPPAVETPKSPLPKPSPERKTTKDPVGPADPRISPREDPNEKKAHEVLDALLNLEGLTADKFEARAQEIEKALPPYAETLIGIRAKSTIEKLRLPPGPVQEPPKPDVVLGGNPQVNATGELDRKTLGAWRGVYGADGYYLPAFKTQGTGERSESEALSLIPAYISNFKIADGTAYAWPQKITEKTLVSPDGQTRRMTVIFHPTAFTFNLTAKQACRISLYCIDPEALDREEDLDLLDEKGNVLKHLHLSAADLTNGVYVTFAVEGTVAIRFKNTRDTVGNAVCSGIFFDAQPIAFESDRKTRGAWKGIYGADGYFLPGFKAAGSGIVPESEDFFLFPAYLSDFKVSESGLRFAWTKGEYKDRALQSPDGQEGRVGCLHSDTTFTVHFTTKQPCRITLYCLDPDAYGREQDVELLDEKGTPIKTQHMSNEDLLTGVYLSFTAEGPITLRFKNLKALKNAVCNGIFFDPLHASTVFDMDRKSQGAWKGLYGADGYFLPAFKSAIATFGDAADADDVALIPAYIADFKTDAVRFAWGKGQENEFAPFGPNKEERRSACAYHPTQFSISFNAKQPCRVTFYCYDVKKWGRVQEVDQLDDKGAVVRHLKLSNEDLLGGIALSFPASGRTTLRFKNLNLDKNAICNAVFFDPPSASADAVKNPVPVAKVSPAKETLRPGLNGTLFKGVALEAGEVVTHFNSPKLNFSSSAPITPDCPAENFSVRWEGFLKVEKTGDYALAVRADDGMRLYVDGKVAIDDWVAHPVSRSATTLKLSEGLHELKLEFFQGTVTYAIELLWQPPGADSETTIPPDNLCYDARANLEAALAKSKPGLAGFYFKGDQPKPEDLVLKRADPKLDLDWKGSIQEPTHSRKQYLIAWQGQLMVPKTGTYTLSDDGDNTLEVLIDGKVVLYHHDHMPLGKNSTEVELTEGLHDFKATYIKWSTGGKVKLCWAQKDGFKAQPIPAEAFSYDPKLLEQSADKVLPMDLRIYLSDMQENDPKVGAGAFGKNGLGGLSGTDKVKVNAIDYPHGLFMHGTTRGISHVIYNLGKQYRVLSGQVALNDSSTHSKTAMTFRIMGDGRELWKCYPAIGDPKKSQSFSIEVTGVDKLELQVDCPGDNTGAHAVWLDPQLLK